MIRCIHCGLPLDDAQCFKCFPKVTKPSREAMIKLAVLNAATDLSCFKNPRGFLRSYVELADSNQFLSGGAWIIPFIIAEFRKLEAQYQ